MRKWIRNLAALEAAAPTAKLVQKLPTRAATPELTDDAMSDSESLVSADASAAPASPVDGQLLGAGRAEWPDGLGCRWDDDMRAARELLSLGAMFSTTASQCSEACEM